MVNDTLGGIFNEVLDETLREMADDGEMDCKAPGV
jgi:hypothetical protein